MVTDTSLVMACVGGIGLGFWLCALLVLFGGRG